MLKDGLIFKKMKVYFLAKGTGHMISRISVVIYDLSNISECLFLVISHAFKLRARTTCSSAHEIGENINSCKIICLYISRYFTE